MSEASGYTARFRVLRATAALQARPCCRWQASHLRLVHRIGNGTQSQTRHRKNKESELSKKRGAAVLAQYIAAVVVVDERHRLLRRRSSSSRRVAVGVVGGVGGGG